MKDNALLEQPFVKEPKISVREHIASFIGKLRENIQVKRIVRMQLGQE